MEEAKLMKKISKCAKSFGKCTVEQTATLMAWSEKNGLPVDKFRNVVQKQLEESSEEDWPVIMFSNVFVIYILWYRYKHNNISVLLYFSEDGAKKFDESQSTETKTSEPKLDIPDGCDGTSDSSEIIPNYWANEPLYQNQLEDPEIAKMYFYDFGNDL